jgi:hypothetical protein
MLLFLHAEPTSFWDYSTNHQQEFNSQIRSQVALTYTNPSFTNFEFLIKSFDSSPFPDHIIENHFSINLKMNSGFKIHPKYNYENPLIMDFNIYSMKIIYKNEPKI